MHVPLVKKKEKGDITTLNGGGYDTKQVGEASVIFELFGMWSNPLLPPRQGPLWPGAVASGRVLSLSKIELNCVPILNWIVWTVYMYENGFGIK